MNEKFLSRGKREDTEKWVEGYYVELPKGLESEPFHVIFELDGQCNRIIPETAGRYTGLTDKNKKRIYSGDIVKAKFHGGIFPDIEPDFTEKIEFRNGCFWFGNCNFIEFLDKFRNYEIIDYIHDNKQMFERADMSVPDDVSQPVLMPATQTENFELMQG